MDNHSHDALLNCHTKYFECFISFSISLALDFVNFFFYVTSILIHTPLYFYSFQEHHLLFLTNRRAFFLYLESSKPIKVHLIHICDRPQHYCPRLIPCFNIIAPSDCVLLSLHWLNVQLFWKLACITHP